MKKLLLTLLLALTLGAGAAWAESSFTIVFQKGSNSNQTSGKNGYTAFVESTSEKYLTGSPTSLKYVCAKATNGVRVGMAGGSAAGVFPLHLATDYQKKITRIVIVSSSYAGSKSNKNSSWQVTINNVKGTVFDSAFTNTEQEFAINATEAIKDITISTTAGVEISQLTVYYNDGPVVPTAITTTPAAENDVITVNKGDEVKFTSTNAAKLMYSTDLDTYTEVTGDTYTFTPENSYDSFHIYPVDSEGNAYNGETDGYADLGFLGSIKVVVPTPQKVTSDPVAVDETIEIVKGESVTFTSELAAKLKVEVDDQAAFVSDGDTYVYTPDKASIITVTPLDADGNEYTDLALMVSVDFKAAPLCGHPAFDPADGSAVFVGSKVTISCENAVKIAYMIDGGDIITVDGSSTDVTINEACSILANGINADGVEGESATASYTIKEADRYALVTSEDDMKESGRYIIIGFENTNEKTPYALGVYKNGNNHPQATTSVVVNDNKFVAAENNDYNILKIAKQQDGTYTFQSTITGSEFYFTITTNDNRLTGNKTTPSYFDVSFNDNGSVNIVPKSYTSRHLCYNQSNDIFACYTASGTATSLPVYLYRLIDEEYVDAPAKLYIHGHFWDRYYDFSQPVEMTADESGKVFTAEGIFIGGNEDASQNGFALSYVFSDSKAEAAAAQGRAVDGVDWSGLAGNVYHQNGNTHTVTGNTEEIEPWVVAKEGRYDITADFSGFSPVFSAKESTTTGVEGIGVDAAEAVYYNLQGVRVANPANGIYIRHQGAAVSKVYVK